MATDSKILPPNFSAIYKLQSVDSYDPLYLERYGELVAASERDMPNINPPFGFNRIITPRNFESKIIDLLGVKYVLSLSDISSNKLKKVYQEGQTRLYENTKALPRAFFVEKTIFSQSKEETIREMFASNLEKIAIVENAKSSDWQIGEAEVIDYEENKVVIATENKGDGFMVLTDSFYPSWHATIDGKETGIVRSDFNFRGIVVPRGTHRIEFYITLL